MKKIKKILIGLIVLSQTVFSYQDIDKDSWEGKAVMELYEKGILTSSIMELESFEGDKTFSRYEIASILYNSIKYNTEQLQMNADAQDIVILKALISEYGNELGQLGAENDELRKELQTTEDRINARMDSKFSELRTELDRVRVNGDVSLVKTLQDEDGESGFKEIELEGEVNILTKINDDIKAEIKLDPEDGLEAYELRLQNERLELIVFEDESNEKRLPTFLSTFGILDGEAIDVEDAVIAKGALAGKDYTALMASSTAGDIVAAEWQGTFNYFDSREGTTSDMALSYSSLNNSDTGAEKGIFSFAPNFEFTLSDKTKSYFNFEYGSINNSEDYDLDGDSIEYTLPADDTTALLLYNRVETTLNSGAKRIFTVGGINTGTDFDIDGLGDVNKNPFRETDLVSVEANKMGSIFGAEYKNSELNSAIYYSTYASNDPSDEKEQRYKLSNLYSPMRKNYKLGLDLLQDESFDYNADESDTELYKRYIVMPKLYLNDIIKDNSENKFMYAYISNDDTDKQSWKLYGDHTQILDSEKSVKYVSQYFDDRETESKEIEFGWNFERTGMTIGKEEKAKPADLIIGARLTDLAYDTANLDDERSARLFFAQKIYYKSWTLLYGAKYQITLERETTSSSLKDLDDSDDFKAGFEIDYNFSDDVEIGFVYGPAEIYESDDEDDFLYDRTSAFDGEQDQATFKISAKF